jgi:hypothetical protein
MPKVYRTPGDRAVADRGMTYYRGFAARGSVFDPDRPTPWDALDRGDRRARTVLVFESSEAVPWTRPADVRFDPVTLADRLPLRNGGFDALYCDGSVRFIEGEWKDDETLRRAVLYRDAAGGN